MTPIRIDPELQKLGLLACALEATPAERSSFRRQAFDRLREVTMAELTRRDYAQTAPATIPALVALQRRYCGRSKPVDPTPVRLAKDLLHGKVRSIHPIVDVYNLWSARLGLSIGAFDVDRIQGAVSVRVTDGSERFCPLGAKDKTAKNVEPGCFAYVDESGDVLCWLDVRQGESTKLTAATRRVLLLIEGVPPLTVAGLQDCGRRIGESLLETGAVSEYRIYA
jgi:phenylalanyl-tRNA synthetase beta subunit